MLLTTKENWERMIRVTTAKMLILGIIIGLAWGFCAGMLFEQYHQRLKPPAPPVMKGIEF